MRIRCSKGLRINSFYGHFFIRSTDLLALPACDANKVCVRWAAPTLGGGGSLFLRFCVGAWAAWNRQLRVYSPP